ncbi:MAG: preprotein translocase subunit SecG, partial [Christensenellales bacterium]|nr:preprotein translocase subunit SecG [Christensenellales bacterium]
MTALSIIIDIVLILISIVLITVVLMQEGQRQGLGAIGGGAETFFGKNLGSNAEGKLKRYTKILAGSFIILAIVATIITAKLNPVQNTTLDLSDVGYTVNENGEVVLDEAALQSAIENSVSID